ncbi:MAG TPA: hypothetical protein VNN21_03870 [Dehalococcoidia bacterium]|nr:hypothetical protein [Dehalococcoidia bacterium]
MQNLLRPALVATAALLALASGYAVFASADSKERSGTIQAQAAAQEPLGEGAMRNAEAIAKQFDISTQDVVGLHEQGFGFGAIVKLLTLAKAKDVSANTLAASIPVVNGEREPNFGEMFKALTDQERQRIEGLPKNLGQIKRGQAAKPRTR